MYSSCFNLIFVVFLCLVCITSEALDWDVREELESNVVNDPITNYHPKMIYGTPLYSHSSEETEPISQGSYGFLFTNNNQS